MTLKSSVIERAAQEHSLGLNACSGVRDLIERGRSSLGSHRRQNTNTASKNILEPLAWYCCGFWPWVEGLDLIIHGAKMALDNRVWSGFCK